MPLIEINRNPTDKDLRWFGLLLAAFFAVVGAIVWWRTGQTRVPALLVGCGAGLSAVYYLVPRLRRPLFLGWMYAAWPVGTLVSMVLLALVYFLVVTPIGLLVRLVSHDPLRRAFDSRLTSYWVRRGPPSWASRYFRQF
jgi:ABC-type uncharacterized transport system permease subunit